MKSGEMCWVRLPEATAAGVPRLRWARTGREVQPQASRAQLPFLNTTKMTSHKDKVYIEYKTVNSTCFFFNKIIVLTAFVYCF